MSDNKQKLWPVVVAGAITGAGLTYLTLTDDSDQVSVEQVQLASQHASDSKTTDSKTVDSKTVDTKTVDTKTVENKKTEATNKSADKSAEQKSDDKSDDKSTESKQTQSSQAYNALDVKNLVLEQLIEQARKAKQTSKNTITKDPRTNHKSSVTPDVWVPALPHGELKAPQVINDNNQKDQKDQQAQQQAEFKPDPYKTLLENLFAKQSFLVQQKAQQAVNGAEQLADKAKEEAKGLADIAKELAVKAVDKAKELADKAKHEAQELADKAKNQIDGSADKTNNQNTPNNEQNKNQNKEHPQEQQSTTQAVVQTGEQTKKLISDFVNKVKDKASELKDTIQDKAKELKHQVEKRLDSHADDKALVEQLTKEVEQTQKALTQAREYAAKLETNLAKLNNDLKIQVLERKLEELKHALKDAQAKVLISQDPSKVIAPTPAPTLHETPEVTPEGVNPETPQPPAKSPDAKSNPVVEFGEQALKGLPSEAETAQKQTSEKNNEQTSEQTTQDEKALDVVPVEDPELQSEQQSEQQSEPLVQTYTIDNYIKNGVNPETKGTTPYVNNNDTQTWPNPTQPPANAGIFVEGQFKSLEQIAQAGKQNVPAYNQTDSLTQTFTVDNSQQDNSLQDRLTWVLNPNNPLINFSDKFLNPQQAIEQYNQVREKLLKATAEKYYLLASQLTTQQNLAHDIAGYAYLDPQAKLGDFRSVGVLVSPANRKGFWPNPRPSRDVIIYSSAYALYNPLLSDPWAELTAFHLDSAYDLRERNTGSNTFSFYLTNTLPVDSKLAFEPNSLNQKQDDLVLKINEQIKLFLAELGYKVEQVDEKTQPTPEENNQAQPEQQQEQKQEEPAQPEKKLPIEPSNPVFDA